MTRNEILSKLDRVERLASGGKFSRLLSAPVKYLTAAVFNKVIYAKHKKPLTRSSTSCYGTSFTVDLPAGTDIYLTGGKTHISEIRLARFLVKYLQEGQSYVDVGAHYGFFSGLAAQLTAAEKVTCFEPAPDTFRLLQQNLNGLSIDLRQKGIADLKDTLTFYQFPAQYSEYNSLDIDQYANEAWIKDYPPTAVSVAISTLDKELKVAPDFLKIDVEGAEDRVIVGGAEQLRTGNTVVIMEYLPAGYSNGSHVRALQLLNGWGYQTYQLNDAGIPQCCPEPEKWLLASGQDSANLVFATAGTAKLRFAK